MPKLIRVPALMAVVAIAATLTLGLLAGPAQAALRHIDGRVVSKNAAAKTFRISTQSGDLRIRVNATTQFERIPGGFGGLHKGMKIEVDAKPTSGGPLARQVEPQGGGGSDGGGAGGGSDDGPNHT